MVDRFWHATLCLVVLLVAGCSRPHGPDPADRVMEYVVAANAHDLKRVREILAEDPTWQLLGETRRGLEAVLAPHEQDITMHTHLDVAVDSVHGDTVWTRVTERNGFLDAFGVDSLVQPTRFVLAEGRIAEMGPYGPGAADPFGGALGPFFQWVRTQRPEAWGQLVDSAGATVYSRANGTLLIRLAREWRDRQ